MAQWLVVQFLCLVVMATAGNCSEEVGDCDIRFEDSGACVHDSSNTAGPIGPYGNTGRSIKLESCYCMYYDSTQNQSIVGHCYFSCTIPPTHTKISSSTEFNADICSTLGHLNRVGRFCGQCNDSYGLAAYSYHYRECIPCQDYGYKNWLRYFAVAFLPLTVFYIVAVLLSFNITSSSFNGMVFVLQCIVSPQMLMMSHDALDCKSLNYLTFNQSTVSTLFVIVTSILSVVNLDFFRLVYPPFCLHPRANIYQILSLDYLVALHPFLLIFMTYVLVTAYDKRYRLVVWMWRPVQRCVHRHRNTWNIRTSLIEIFATFILFSYVKILNVSIQILAFTATYDVHGNKLQQYFTFLDGTMEYFGSTHLPYALLAITISFLFVVLPFLLLAVYPCRCFHKCLNCHELRCQALHVFMDAFQGSYSIQPRDLRYFSAFYLLMRLIMVFLMFITVSYIMFFFFGMLFLLSAAIVAVFQPYKVRAHNTIDSVLMILTGIFFVCYFHNAISHFYSTEVGSFLLLSVLLLLLYFIFLVIWKLVGGTLQALLGKVRMLLSSVAHHPREYCRGEAGIEEFDRGLEASERNSYPPLLRGSNKPTY